MNSGTRSGTRFPESREAAPPFALSPPTMCRPFSGPLWGTTKIVAGSWGWIANGKPNSEGRPDVISVQLSPPFSVT